VYFDNHPSIVIGFLLEFEPENCIVFDFKTTFFQQESYLSETKCRIRTIFVLGLNDFYFLNLEGVLKEFLSL